MADVLIATMDSADYDILSSEIAGEGHDVICATDGHEALEMVTSRHPFLVFLDSALPIFDGFEVAERLRGDPDIPKALPLLLFTDEAVEPHHFERVGFDAHFPKTHDYHALREILSHYANLSTISDMYTRLK